MKAYWIAMYKKIDSQENIQNYGAKVTEVFKSYNAKPIVRGGKFNTLEGETYPRTVIWEFPSFEKEHLCGSEFSYSFGTFGNSMFC